MDKRQKKIIQCLKPYPVATDEERRQITASVLESIAEAEIEGEIGFDIRDKFNTLITFESKTEIPECKSTKLEEILSTKFERKDILLGVRKDRDYIEEYDLDNPSQRRCYYEDVWNLFISIPHDNPEIQ